MSDLVEAEVEVAPARHAGVPFQHVAGEVQVEDLDLFFDRLGEAVVHRGGGRSADHHRVVLVLRAGVPRVDSVNVGALPRNRQRLLAFPVRQRAAPRIGGQQVDQMRRARAGHADDDEGLLDRDRLDLGMPFEQFGQRQPVAQQPHDALAQRPADQLGQAVVGLDRPDVGSDAIPEPVGGGEVVDACFGDPLGDHPLDVQVDVAALGVLEDLPLDIGQLRSGQIVETELLEI